MSVSPASQSFLQLIVRSQLIPESVMTRIATVASAALETSGQPVTTASLAEWFVHHEYLTRWQADKLLQGRHRGFFLGRYRLQSRIARGGMSTIYSAVETENRRQVALKVLPLSRVSQSSYLPRFVREAEIAKRLDHPNIVRVYDIHTASDGVNQVHFMAMELLDGKDLNELIQTDGPLPCLTAVDFIIQATRGLQYAHDAGLVHRDIKPANLFLTRNGVIRILDLGLAQDFETEQNLTREHNERVLGTADYLSPEQAVDSHLADGRADIYSLGCTLYFLLTGQPPFNDGTLAQRILAHQSRLPAPLSVFRRDVPDDLQSIFSSMTEKDRSKRIQTASEVTERLADWLKQHSNDGHLKVRPEQLRGRELQHEQHQFRSSASLDAFLSQSTSLTQDALPDSVPKRTGSSATGDMSRVSPDSTRSSPAASDTQPVVSSSPFIPEFDGFLRYLNQDSGLSAVLQPESLSQQMTMVADSLPATSTEKESADIPTSLNTPAAKRRFSRRTIFWTAITLFLAVLTASISGLIYLKPEWLRELSGLIQNTDR
jgi:serine/threonine protein kinase